MSIEKDIKQVSKFRNEWHKASVNVIFTSSWIIEKQKTHFDKGSLTQQQYNILRILRGSAKPLSTLQIRERMLDKMSDTSRIVDRMVLKNLVTKSINKDDKRLVDIEITKKGKELIDWMDNSAHEIDEIINNLTEAEAKTINLLLDKIREKK
jgi:DNA-binding MarR family transcriptional regulator